MTIETRRPTGLPSWPITLAAGMQSAGKSFLAAVASASPLVSRTFWLSYGEKDPDELGAIPGADFEIVSHNGTIRGVTSIIREIAALPVPADGPNLIVLDSASRYWDTIYDNVQHAAIRRANGRPTDADSNIDLWTPAKADWQAMLQALRDHKGPSIITARFEEATVVVDGKATTKKEWKVKAEKGLPYDVDAVVEMRSRGDYRLTKVRSASMPFEETRSWPGFTMDALWRELGLDGETGVATYAQPVADVDESPDTSGRDWLTELREAVTAKAVADIGTAAIAAKADREVLAAIRKKHNTLMPPTRPADKPSAGIQQEGSQHG